MFENTSILVTGGAGFIGSHICKFLCQNNVKLLRIVDNLSTGFKNNIADITNNNNVEFVCGDITDIEICRQAVKNIDIVCHQAAVGSVPLSINDPLRSFNNNVNGFFNIILACQEVGIKRFVYASSSSVYGDDTSEKKSEDIIGKPLSPYAATKYIDEILAGMFHRVYSFESIGLRYFNVFGPNQNPNGPYAAVIPKFINSLANKEPVTINGDGNNSRDFTYVDNVVFANILALSTNDANCYGQVFNIATSNEVTINDLFYTIRNQLNSDSNQEPIYGPARKGDVINSCANIQNARKFLKYEPKVMFNEGIKKTITSFI